MFIFSEKARLRRAQMQEANRATLIAKLDGKGLLGKDDAIRLAEERAREERRRLAGEAAEETRKQMEGLCQVAPSREEFPERGFQEWDDFYN